MAMTRLLPSPKTMISFDGKQLSNLVEGHITVVISVVAVLVLTYVILIRVILGVLGGLFFLFIVFLFAARTGLKFALFGGHKEGPDKCENSQIKHDEPTTLSGKWACSSEQLPSQGQGLGTIHSLSNDFKVFEKEELVAATENFHHNNHLGQGSFGAVYKGTTSQGSEIAVKKLSLNSKQGKDEFVNEIRLVAKVRHRNLVKLLGCCAEGSERLIVYEYLPNNSLYTFLFDPNKRSHLDWEKRYSIILGVSRGLLYLHEDSPLRIIHRDIKAGNILLDTKFNPKIADFGIARLLEEDESHVRTRPAGTRGYWAPEYAMEGQLSVKADVYSFGILLLELISGRKSIDFNLEDEMQVLSDWVKSLNRGGNLVSMIDPVIIETCGDKKEQVLRCIHVGLSCIQAEAPLRPPMSSINVMLSTQFMNSTLNVYSTTGSEKSKFWKGKFWNSKKAETLHSEKSKFWKGNFWNSKKAETLHSEKSKFWKGKFWNSKKAETLHSDSERRDGSSGSGSLFNPRIVFTLDILTEATGEFHEYNKLGEGGFGAVYKGVTSDGREIAVKKLSLRSAQGTREFMNEARLVANVQHRNLVQLLGCCVEGPERLLVYEYLPNKSLDNFLFDPEKRRVLDWQKRYNIVMGIARGLLYLHEDSKLRIIHRDVKVSNILLDDTLNPKIADFGLARLFPEDETDVYTRVAGTYGYMAPEYAMFGQLSVKSDVYSFGVVLLEIVSGRRNSDIDHPWEMQSLLKWGWRLCNGGNLLNMIDPTILGCLEQEQALKCIRVGFLCVQSDVSNRPAMPDVVLMLSTNSVAIPNPTIPGFVSVSFSGDGHTTDGTVTTSSAPSQIQLSVSNL